MNSILKGIDVLFDFINRKLDKLYKSLSNDNVTKCQSCGVDFTWHTWKNECECCHKFCCNQCITTFCEDMNEEFSVKICGKCYRVYSEGIKSMIIVRSGHVGGHKTIKVLEEVSTSEWEDFNDATTALKHQAFLLGGNAVLNYSYKKSKQSEETDSGGTHYYSTFIAYGTAAVIEPHNKGPRIK